MDPHDDLEITLHARPRLLCGVRGLVRGYMSAAGYPPAQTEEIVLAVDEACANAIRHAYRGDESGRISLAFRGLPGHIELELRDAGRTAPPEKVARRDLECPDPGALQPGGLGVQLMYKVFDEVCFLAAEPAGNRVIMRLKTPPTPG